MGRPAVGGRVILTNMQNRQIGRKGVQRNAVARRGDKLFNRRGLLHSFDVKVGLAW